MKKLNLKLLSSLVLTVLGITQICVVVLLTFTGNVNYLYAAVSLMASMFFIVVFFNRLID